MVKKKRKRREGKNTDTNLKGERAQSEIPKEKKKGRGGEIAH